MKKQDYLKAIYPRDENTGAFIIDVSLDGYDDLFNEWDRSPLKRRDLDPELYNFLKESSEEIPLKYPIIVALHLPRLSKNRQREKTLLKGWENFFAFNAQLVSREIKNSNNRTAVYVVTAFSFLAVAYFFQPLFKDLVFFDILVEGFFIGGWVFLWEAFSLIFFESKNPRRTRKEYQRLLNSEIRFIYDQ